ncbi:MAG: hypothetical protein KJS97_01165 [Alphaproteobacteria bacterium]|nr:hypothetical protein [Alphaproteobacteria bacterium]
MTKLDHLIERLRALPGPEQDRIVAEIEAALDGASALTDAQWREIESAIDSDGDEGGLAHDDVVAAWRARRV